MTDDRFLAGAAGALLVALAVVMLGTVLAAYGTGYATVVRVNAHGEFWADAALLAGCAVFGAAKGRTSPIGGSAGEPSP